MLSVFPVWVSALGLGAIHVESALNAPLKAQIELISVDPDAVADIRVKLASPEVFAKAGIARPFYLSKVRFKPYTRTDGASVIAVTSRQNIREPFLNFLLEVEFLGQSLVREYTILLDPPIYTPPKTAGQRRPVAAASSPSSPTDARASEAGAAVYGPVRASENLWTIAKKTRPSSSLSIEQMMLALQRKNPEAFRGNNVNRLRQGAVLTIPAIGEIQLLDAKAARTEFMRQTKVWRQRGKSKKSSKPAPPMAQKIPAQVADESSKSRQKPPAEGNQPAPTISEAVPLKVVETGEESAAKGIVREGYPVEQQDKIKEAIADTEGNLAAVNEINQDIGELKRTLEAKMAALHAALAEKDEAIAALRAQLELPRQGEPKTVESDQGGISGPISPSQDGVVGKGVSSSVQQPAAKPPQSMASNVAELAVSSVVDTTTPERSVLPWWRDSRWLVTLGMGGFLSILLMALLFRKREPRHEPERDDYAFSYKEMESETDAVQPEIMVEEGVQEFVHDRVDTIAKKVQSEAPAEAAVDVSAVLTEADIYLAYRRYSQAESLVGEAIEQDPQNLALKAKILEIYAFKRDKSAFALYLDEYGATLAADSAEHWSRIVEIGRDLVPDHPLFDVEETAGPLTAKPDDGVPEHRDSLFESEDLASELDISLDDFIINHDEIEKDLEVKKGKGSADSSTKEGPSWDIDLDFSDDDFPPK